MEIRLLQPGRENAAWIEPVRYLAGRRTIAIHADFREIFFSADLAHEHKNTIPNPDELFGKQNAYGMKPPGIMKIVFSLAGAALLAFAATAWQETRSFIANAERTRGTVVNLVTGSSSMSAALMPVLRFNDREGNTVVFISQTGTNPPSWKIGDTAEVLYLPEKPEGARINDFFELWGGILVKSVIGLVFLLTAGGTTLFDTLQRQRERSLRRNGIPLDATLQSGPRNTSDRAGQETP